MVEITNGTSSFRVPLGAYYEIFQKQGYKLLVQDKKANSELPQASEEAATASVLEELLEKPLNTWTKNEVKLFARENQIDLVGTKDIKEAKARIKDWITSNK